MRYHLLLTVLIEQGLDFQASNSLTLIEVCRGLLKVGLNFNLLRKALHFRPNIIRDVDTPDLFPEGE